MDIEIFPSSVQNALRKLNSEKISEIRFRKGYPVTIKFDNEFYYVSDKGVSSFSQNCILCTSDEIEKIISTMTDNSLYAFNERLKDGYLTWRDGTRCGVAGECVYDKNGIVTVKNITSLNFRIPHEIAGCSKKIMPFIRNGGKTLNSIIVSPPGFGKTTILKDIVKNLPQNEQILICDERGEFINVGGKNVDKIVYSNKKYVFECGIRSMSPSIVVFDELIEKDWLAVNKTVLTGVKVIASAHGDTLEKLKTNEYFNDGLFERYVFLKGVGKAGVIDKIYDGNFKEIS